MVNMDSLDEVFSISDKNQLFVLQVLFEEYFEGETNVVSLPNLYKSQDLPSDPDVSLNARKVRVKRAVDVLEEKGVVVSTKSGVTRYCYLSDETKNQLEEAKKWVVENRQEFGLD